MSSFIAGICIGLMIGKVGYLGKLVLVMLFEPCSFFCFFYLINSVLIIYLSYNIIADKLGIDYKQIFILILEKTQNIGTKVVLNKDFLFHF